MILKRIKQTTAILFLLVTLSLAGCQTGNLPAEAVATETEPQSLAPEFVDVRGSVVRRQYNQGQVMLEVENFGSPLDSRYDRAYVLVLPTTQIVDTDGSPISLNELQQGQQVAVQLRSGGKGNSTGTGIARKMWVEDLY